MTPHVQEFIHRFEVGEGSRWLRGFVALLAFGVIGALYLLFEFENLSRPGAMDAAQIGREVAQGHGFSTGCIRPLSVQLLERRAEVVGSSGEDSGHLHGLHPDLANPPVYPLLLGAVFALTEPEFQISGPSRFSVYGPDRLVVIVNIVLLLGVAVLTYVLALRLFDGFVAALTSLAICGSEQSWRLAATGEAVMLATFWVVLLALCLAEYDRVVRDPEGARVGPTAWAAFSGGVLGLAGMTVYGLLVLAVPVAVVLWPGLKGRQWRGLGAALLGVLLVVSPWLIRNYQLSGACFGTAPAALLRDSPDFPGDGLERSLETFSTPGMIRYRLSGIAPRFGEVLQNDLTRVGGSWIAAFFFVGLLFRFAQPSRNVLRSFVLLGLTALLPVQALVGPGAAENSVMSGADYLAVTAPLVLLFAAAFFVSMLEHVDWPVEGVRLLAVSAFCLVAVLPVALVLSPPGRRPSAFPPYHPPWIQEVGDWLKPDELTMSDIPWAVAWYANRRCLWIPAYAEEPGHREDFFAVDTHRAKVVGLYLTQSTTDRPFFSTMLDPQRRRQDAMSGVGTGQVEASLSVSSGLRAVGWPEFAHRSLTELWLPEGFPLRTANGRFRNSGQLLIMDRSRWREVSPESGDGGVLKSGVSGGSKTDVSGASRNP